jgi:predicted dehydrogenase
MLPAVLARQDVIVTALVDPNATSVEEARKVGAKEASMFASVEDALRADRVMDGYRRNIAYLAGKGMRL